MTISVSRLAYEDCYKVMDAALEDAIGARVKFIDHGTAMFFRMRLHQARKIDRKDNMQLYEEDHPLYGRSAYDKLAARVIDAWVYVEKIGIDLGEIEPLSGQAQLPPPEPILQLEASTPTDTIRRRL